jgi:hypothetical protein
VFMYHSENMGVKALKVLKKLYNLLYFLDK